MKDLRRVLPRPSAVTLGGRPFLASELRLDDIADLADYVERCVPCPYDVAAKFLEGAPDRPLAWKLLLSDTLDRQERWPPTIPGPEANALFRTDAGLAHFARVVLRREHQALTPDATLAALADATADEWSRLVRKAWAVDPLDLIAGLVDGPDEAEPPPGKPIDWGKVWYAYGTTFHHGPPFGQLTYTMFRLFLAEGETPEPGSHGGESGFDHAKDARRAAFWREVDDFEAARREG